ncbi:hypothetical protein [Flavobacterium phragmitis]|uniref:Uncharacterized protein n=1 Tax=Flavobacterium phragmitis TaxID=739143 RepID=A0A1I1U4G0_9FLAO|nr:hypothetical protein [Flavobacterium phragmitis]SFD65585.1 hypothetical protein SAMN05216297_110182 [Flavobacterium phragmitis]
MKLKLLLITVVLCVLNQKLHSQDNPCTYAWGKWYSVYSLGYNNDVQISFKYQIHDRKGGSCGQSYYRFYNPTAKENCSVKFKFDYKGNDGTINTEDVTIDLDKSGVKEWNASQWYNGYEMTRIYNIQYVDYNSKKNEKKENNNDISVQLKGYREEAQSISQKYNSLISASSNITGENIDKSRLEALKDEYRKYSSSFNTAMNSVAYTYTFEESNRKEVEYNLNKMENAVDEIEIELKNLGTKEKISSKDNKKSDTTKSNSNSNSSSTYVESEESRQLRERAKAQSDINRQEDEITVAGLGGVVGIGAALVGATDGDYDDEEYPFVLRGLLGANYQSIPVVTNYNGKGFNPGSENSTTNPTNFSIGLDAKFFHDRFIGFNVNPFFNYGLLAFSSNTGDMMNYGGNFNVKIGHALQLILKGAYEVRTGEDKYDAAEILIDGTTYSKYDYNTLKYGVGIKYKFVELSAFKENLSFLNEMPQNVFSYELSMNYAWFGMLIRYAPNYPCAGEIQYPNAYNSSEKQSLLQIGMYWRISIAKSK